MHTYKKIIYFFMLNAVLFLNATLPLFKYYPDLQQKIYYTALGTFPTPITKYPTTCQTTKIYIKNDGICGKQTTNNAYLFGGNKVRKLEFVLADAVQCGSSHVITFGCAGSNHALATTIYANILGLRSICLLSPQPHSSIVRRNLLLQQYYGAELHFYESATKRALGAYDHFIAHYQKNKTLPYVIPTGASNPLGCLGFVNAAFELYEQIQQDIMPLPDILYVAAGSLGTLSGLLLGIRAVGLPTKIIGVAIEPCSKQHTVEKILSLVTATNKFIYDNDPSFPLFEWHEHDIALTTDFAEPKYGACTKEVMHAIDTFKKTEQGALDTVYSGKAFAALLDHLKKGFLDNKTILFWNTFCSDSFENIINTVDYKTLPTDFHRYFEESYNS